MSLVSITFGREAVGSVDFVQPEVGLSAVRTASGFRIPIPAVVSFSPPWGSGLPLMLENLRAIFSAQNETGKLIEIGVAYHPQILCTPIDGSPRTLLWDWTLEALAFYERLRAGRDPKFHLTVSGDIRYLLPGDGGKQLSSLPTRFQEHGEVGYSQRVWINMMRALNLQDAMLVEIPFPSDPPTGWEPVWEALRDARDSFDKGGATGWKGCVTSVRLALEEWRKIEAEVKGPADLQSRTKSQRTDNIRWQLIQLANYAAHTRADEWTRDDAVLALSTLCGLLCVRKP